MKSFKKFILVALVGMFAALSLTGCGGDGQGDSIDNPAINGYSVEYVSTSDGDFKCLWYSKGDRWGSMSCDEITEVKK